MRLFILFYILLSILSCSKVDCNEYTKMISEEQCNIVLTSQPTNYGWFELNGYDPITQEIKVYKTNNRWWNLYINEMDIGDTITKKNGELNLYIHKKDSVISHKWKCYNN